ncbi:MAG TPA: YcaO-like family protein [Glycomyces sp.]|nr:YcaO-like family protein [Glycomyces sp.]
MPDTAAASLWVYGLDGAALVVAADGSQWIVDADPPTLLGPDGAEPLAEIAATVRPGEPPRLDPGDLRLDSNRHLLAVARDTDRSPDTGQRTAAWPFAGRWHRLALVPGRAEGLARQALACLRATVPDADLAEALCGSAASVPELGPAYGAVEPPPADTLMRWNGTGASWEPHRLAPAPAVDPVTGLLRRIVPRPRDPAMPPGFVHAHAELPHLSSADPRLQADALAPAGALDEDEAREAATLSGVEHYCGADFGGGERRLASLAELRREGERAVAIDEWEPHDPALHDRPGFPFERFTADRPLWWIAGEERGERCWAPVSLVHIGWLQAGPEPATVFHGHNFAGMKAGRTLAEATERACAHLVAHDAVAVWWSKGRGARLRSAPLTDAVHRAWSGCELELRLLAVPSTTGAPVRLAIVDDADRGIVSLGVAAHRFTDRAGELAVVEALIQHASARDLDSPDSLIRNAEALGNGAVVGLAPYDRDRRYRDAFGSDHRGMIDPMCHVQLGLDPRVADLVRARTLPAGPIAPVEPEGEPVRSALERSGHRVVVVDATAERARSAGYAVARVIVPGLARMQPAAFPLDPNARTTSAAAALGWEAAAPPEPTPYPGW